MEPWYKNTAPRPEVREGRSFNPDEFAIALALDTGWSGLTASDVNVVTALLVAIALFLPGRNFSLRKSARGAAR